MDRYRYDYEQAAEQLIRALQSQQHLAPHQALAEALDKVQQTVGLCAASVRQALEVLELDPQRCVGRLRSAELAQLARVIKRLWQQGPPRVAAV